ncbi:MAG: MoaD/ThiS family protein [Jatrophihabitantaceae bacterium]
MVKIILPAGWTEGRRAEFDGTEGLLPDVIRQFAADNPAYRHRLLGPNDQPLTYVNICVNDELIPRYLRDSTVVQPDNTITVIAPMAGG